MWLKSALCHAGLRLMLLTFNRQMRVFGVMRMDLQWDRGGTINAQLQIGAIPLLADSASTRYTASYSQL